MDDKIIVNLCIIYKDKKVLLARHTRGPGVGRLDGYGGKVVDEDIEASVRREVKEESGLEVGRLEKMGVIEFTFSKDGNVMECHFFRTDDFYGEPRETEEMKSPQWYDYGNLPYDEMWPDDIYWLPLLLGGKKFEGSFLLGENDKVLEYELKEHGLAEEIRDNKIKIK